MVWISTDKTTIYKQTQNETINQIQPVISHKELDIEVHLLLPLQVDLLEGDMLGMNKYNLHSSDSSVKIISHANKRSKSRCIIRKSVKQLEQRESI